MEQIDEAIIIEIPRRASLSITVLNRQSGGGSDVRVSSPRESKQGIRMIRPGTGVILTGMPVFTLWQIEVRLAILVIVQNRDASSRGFKNADSVGLRVRALKVRELQTESGRIVFKVNLGNRGCGRFCLARIRKLNGIEIGITAEIKGPSQIPIRRESRSLCGDFEFLIESARKGVCRTEHFGNQACPRSM